MAVENMTYTMATIVGQDSKNSGSMSYNTDNVSCVGCLDTILFTYALKFTTPYNFYGIPQNISFSFNIITELDVDTTLNYALCTSDANIAKYQNTSSAVVDTHQINAGLTTVTSGTTNYILEIPVSQLEEGTTYYLIMWNNTGNSNALLFREALNHTITITFVAGLVYIEDETGFNPHIIYIDDGANWNIYEPYFDVVAGWLN